MRGIGVVLWSLLVVGCGELSPELLDYVHPADTHSASAHANAHCAWVMVTVTWPEGRVQPRTSGYCTGALPLPPRPLGQ